MKKIESKSPHSKESDFRKRVLNQLQANRQKFYSNFFLQNPRNDFSSGSDKSSSRKKADNKSEMMKRKAKELYMKYDLQYS